MVAILPNTGNETRPRGRNKIEQLRKKKSKDKIVRNGLGWCWYHHYKQPKCGFPDSLCVVFHTPENYENYKKTMKDRDKTCLIKAYQSKAEAKWLIQTNNEASTNPPKMIIGDHLKQVLMNGNNQ